MTETGGRSSEMGERLAEKLRAARKAQRLSLEALSAASGVSRSMLSAIERGESSPTVATLWNLTRALRVDLGALLDEGARSSSPIVEVVRAGQAPVIAARGRGCRITILSPPDDVGGAEIYDIRFDADGALESDPHGAGAIEHLTVLEGDVDVTADQATERASAGDTIRYRVDVPHALRAAGGPARAILVVKGGG